MRLLSLVLLAALSLTSYAQVESQINFRGQNSEVIKIDKDINVIRPQSFQVPDTCYNAIPYQSYECHDVTRYRQQCQNIPSSQNCWTENERVCRNVTRTRQECHTGPSHQECHERPSREVCTERPTREVCHLDSNGQRRCTTVGGGRSCQTVGGGQSCNTIPGERICRNVSYTDQDCDNVPRRRCEYVPARTECRDIPYNENVCSNVTRYRQEPYACERTEYRDVSTPKKLAGTIQVHFLTNGLVEEFPLSLSVGATNAKFEAFSVVLKLLKEPNVLVILKKKTVIADETEEAISLQVDILIEIIEPKMVMPSFPTLLKSPVFKNNILSLDFEGAISAMGSVDLLFTADPKIGRTKTIAQLKASYPSDRAGVIENKINLNLAGLIQNDLAKKNHIVLKLTAPLSVLGEILNATKPVMDKAYNIDLKK